MAADTAADIVLCADTAKNTPCMCGACYVTVVVAQVSCRLFEWRWRPDSKHTATQMRGGFSTLQSVAAARQVKHVRLLRHFPRGLMRGQAYNVFAAVPKGPNERSSFEAVPKGV